jgi:hypothetical protein
VVRGYGRNRLAQNLAAEIFSRHLRSGSRAGACGAGCRPGKKRRS